MAAEVTKGITVSYSEIYDRYTFVAAKVTKGITVSYSETYYRYTVVQVVQLDATEKARITCYDGSHTHHDVGCKHTDTGTVLFGSWHLDSRLL